MPNFVLAYHGGKKFETQEEGMTHMTKWRAWSQNLGDAVIDPGVPVGMSKTVSAEGVVDNGGPNPISGITILQASSFDEVIEMTKACPHIDIGGSIEVAEAMNMDM